MEKENAVFTEFEPEDLETLEMHDNLIDSLSDSEFLDFIDDFIETLRESGAKRYDFKYPHEPRKLIERLKTFVNADAYFQMIFAVDRNIRFDTSIANGIRIWLD